MIADHFLELPWCPCGDDHGYADCPRQAALTTLCADVTAQSDPSFPRDPYDVASEAA